MKLWKKMVLFYLGGAVYMTMEFLWRGRSHGSMFALGGLCFLGMGVLIRFFPRLPLAAKAILGAMMVTVLELVTGLLINGQYEIWDYRNMPANFRGQICLSFSLLWMPVSLFGMWVYDTAERKLFTREL